MQCISNFTESMDGCLDEKEKENKALLNHITTQLFSFVCHKEGDRIACKYLHIFLWIKNGSNLTFFSLLSSVYCREGT